MEHNNYLPQDDGEKLSWLNNFIEKLQQHANSLGFTSSDTITIQQDIQKFRSLLRIKIEYHHAQSIYGLRGPVNINMPAAPRSMNANAFPLPEVPGYLLKRLESTINDIKTHSTYNEDLGKEFGLLRSQNAQKISPDFTNIKSSILINKKKGYSDDNQ